MNETFMLYLFTRLDSIAVVLGLASFLLFFVSGIAIWFSMENRGSLPVCRKIWWSFAVVLALNIITPTQKDVAIILAGSTIMSLAKTDDAKRITSKSVQVVEQYLDAFLKKEKK